MLEGIKKFTRDNLDLIMASGFLVVSGGLDTITTIENMREYGTWVEWNPIIRESVRRMGEGAIYAAKLGASSLAIYAAKKMDDVGYRIDGKYLLYGASMCWLAGALLNVAYR